MANVFKVTRADLSPWGRKVFINGVEISKVIDYSIAEHTKDLDEKTEDKSPIITIRFPVSAILINNMKEDEKEIMTLKP